MAFSSLPELCLATFGTLTATFLLATAPSARAADQPRPEVVVKTLLQATTTGDGQPIVYPKGQPLITARDVTLPPGAVLTLHRHPTPPFVYVLEGELTIQPDGKEPLRFKAGEAFMERGDWHTGRNEGTTPVRLISVYAGEAGVPLSEKAP